MNTKTKVTQIGMDLHKTFSRVTARNVEGRVVWRRRLEHRDRQALRQQLRRWPAGTAVVLESSFGWGWMSDELLDAGLSARLANSRKVAGWREARGLAKNNRLDADLLSELPSQPSPWWEVWLAPPEVRHRREWLRYRMTLVRTQTDLKNRIHAILHRHGILHDFSDLFGCAGREFLDQLASETDITLPRSAQTTLRGYLELLVEVRQRIAHVTREHRKQIDESPMGRRLKSMPGISWILAYTIAAEIGRIARFRSAKHLASYSLLVPRANDSGDEDEETPKGRRIGLIGRRTLKWAFIEAARGAERKSARFRGVYNRRTNNGKKDRNRGHIAVAHELCCIAYALLKKECCYRETPPEEDNRKQSRPKKG